MGKVAIVDDARSSVRMMEAILTSAGHEIVSYADCAELEDRLAETRPDLLLLDIVMPNRNGYDILRSLGKDPRTKDLPVVLVTCRDGESDRLWGRRQGARAYVTKPFTSEELLRVVEQFIP